MLCKYPLVTFVVPDEDKCGRSGSPRVSPKETPSIELISMGARCSVSSRTDLMPTCDASKAGRTETDLFLVPMFGTDPSVSLTKHATALVFGEVFAAFPLTEFWLVPRRLIVAFARLAGEMVFPWVFPSGIRFPMLRPSFFTIRT